MRVTSNGVPVKGSTDLDTDRAFFARLGIAFAISIIVSGVMMFAVGPVPQTGEGAQLALNATAQDVKY